VTPTPHLSLGLLLTAAAGMIDVVGFIELGGFYTSFMSGNTTQLGAGLALWGPKMVLPASLIVMFLAGSFVGSLVSSIGHRQGRIGVLAIVILGLLISLTLYTNGFTPAQAMLALATAAGAQNAVLPQTGAARLGTTFVTGTLFAAGQDMARAVRGEAPPLRWVQHLLVWLSLLLGAAVGAFAYGQWHIGALLLPGLIYLAFMIGYVVKSPK
jgi:uncharacterized membrane protein YoaK (UPF0700 family)